MTESFLERSARLAVRRPVAVTVLAIAVTVLGVLALRQLPLDLLPDLQSPTVAVSVRAGDRPPLEMERQYGEQIEQRLFTVRGIRQVTQVARTGRLTATVVFDWDTDVDLALVDVQKAVGPVAADPDVDEVLVRRFDPRQDPILTLGLVAESGQPDLAELRRLVRRQVAPALEQLPGVAEARVLGGREQQIEVRTNRYRLEALGITLEQLESRLRQANVDLDAGTLEEGSEVLLVRGLSRFRSAEDVAAVVVRYGAAAGASAGLGSPVRVRDVADVALVNEEIDHLVRVDGVEGVGLSIYKEAGANTVEVSRTVREALEGVEGDLPGVAVRLVGDEAALVEDALDDIRTAAGAGILLAVLVLAFFLRSAGATVIVASAVPVSLLAAVFLLSLGDHSLNLITLAGLALGAGMLVDNAIVVVESIHRRRDAGDGPEDAASRGVAEVAGAIIASTLTTCIVFLPVLFVQGLAARLIEGIAFTVTASLLASLAVALWLIPALARWLLPARQGVALQEPPEESFRGAAARVERQVATLLRRPGLVVLAACLAVGLAVLALARLGTELLPPADPRQFSLRLVGPAGQRVEATEEMVAVAEEALRQAAGDDLAAVLSEVGRLPEDDRLLTDEQPEENTARLRLRLDAGPGSPTGSRVAAAARPRLDELLGPRGAELSWEVGVTALARALGTAGPPIAVEIAGRSLDDLRRGAESARQALATRPELWNVRSSFEGGPPELRVELDRALADALGVDLDTVSRVLEAALDGREVTTFALGDEEREVVLRLPSPRRDQLAAVPFTTSDGRTLALGEIARFEPVEGAREIFRRDQRRVARVTARIAEGTAYPQALAATREALDGVDLPPGLTLRLGGEEEERQATFAELRQAALLALLLVLMVLAGSFESLLQPLTVLAAVPLSLVGVAAFLLPAGQPLGVMAMLGLIVLAGVAVNDAILLVAAARRLHADGLALPTALARAAALRLRPILMTTLTTVLALLPLALGRGEAANLRSPMALTLIGGVLASTAASLFVIPCLYLLLDRVRGRRDGSDVARDDGDDR